MYKKINFNNLSGNKKHFLALFISFAVLNSIKIALFNLYIIDDFSAGSVIYKLSFCFAADGLFIIFLTRLSRPYGLIVFYLLQTLFIFSNLSYFLYFHNYLNIFQSLILLPESFATVKHLSLPKSPKLLILLIDAPFVILTAYRYIDIKRLKLRRLANMLSIFIVVTVVIIETITLNNSRMVFQLMKKYPSSETSIIKRYGMLANSVLGFLSNQGSGGLIRLLKYGKEINSQGNNRVKPNFIIIQVESMDASIVKESYMGFPVMPFMNSLTKECAYFPYMLTNHKAGGTSDCEFSALNSVEALGDYPAIQLSHYNFPNSVVKVLASHSYECYGFHGNIAGFYSRGTAYPLMGFKEFYDMKKINLPESGWGIPDKDVFKYVEEKLKTQKSPFLYYVITMSSHGPFNSVKNYYGNDTFNGIKDAPVKSYYNSMSYVDEALKELVTYVQQNFHNTYVFIYGDHTPGIDSNIFKQSSLRLSKSYLEFVPLFLITPEKKKFMENKSAISLIDIAPTILYNSKIPFSFLSNGKNLLNPKDHGEDIPFNGNRYSRDFLFTGIRDALIR